MKASELRSKNADELAKELDENLKEQFGLRMQQAAGQLERPSDMKRVRRNIARIKTILAETSKAS
ncbi:MAG: LSU ribosomal protein L29p (L35e) [uncultured Thiotrichaceae bacterium]|uniref:Large ribosomal subunit protein uL29 n=1 Tax=uncultured Thiotrichaceae bacterium TaxID=298394 RepID=A0A6S6SDP6_9GAMM|nr:MAG: LSU ribosomal protein L29p (L35e) [uncultured Thiotrichaceae bacterium]